MRSFFRFSVLFSLLLTFSGCDQLLQVANETMYGLEPTSGEMTSGLKQALLKGAGDAVGQLGAEGGFLNNPQVKIPFPPEAEFAANTLRDLGLGNLVDDFVARLNRGASEGAKQALPIFRDAITGMSINDAKNILLGNQTAATDYFRARTSNQLAATFSPIIRSTLDEVNATKLWSDITSRYNSIPLVRNKVETDIVKYATDRALDGLFLKVAEEEMKIRENPLERTSEILKKVFGYAEREKQTPAGQ
jgi:hypothetical protein